MFTRIPRHKGSENPAEGSPSTHSSTLSFRNRSPFAKDTLDRTVSASNDAQDVKGRHGLNLLYSPQDPLVDLIFVHGLGGGSRKTWSRKNLYWLQEFLPKDSAFQHVRIHSYGYDSDYMKGKQDSLTIHDMGVALLAAISKSPYIEGSSTHLVAIGHSLGGLVMKKAYILAMESPLHKTLLGRFAALYFLATPHRGSDYAKWLRFILRLGYDRGYVADLQRDSEATGSMNTSFQNRPADTEICSFYETQKMFPFGALIVRKDSALLYDDNEHKEPMAADHRSICKFKSCKDANYVRLRNALALTVKRAATTTSESELKARIERSQALRAYLRVPEILNDDLLSVCEARIQDSCHWLSTKASYTGWKDGHPNTNQVLWIKGKPAAGKSVLAGYVVQQLQQAGEACSYFFFRHADKSKSEFGYCLRSLAFQMATSSPGACSVILRMRAEGVNLERLDERTLWRTLFLSGIFPTMTTRHYWVIDALDECVNSSTFFDALLPRMNGSVPLRLLITSRATADLNQNLSYDSSSVIQHLSISTTDTQADLKLLIMNKLQPDQAGLADTILAKSQGSFLWTILVLTELRASYGAKQAARILERIPEGMEHLYNRTLESMSHSTASTEFPKAILMWVACAVRPMTTGELHGALSLDIHDTFLRLDESIEALCGQLVTIDSLGKVQMIHETAREYLLGSACDSDLLIDKTVAHTRLARVCLEYLAGPELKPPRAPRRRSSADVLTTRQSFAAYAYTEFSYHLSKASPQSTELLSLVDQFFKDNVLSWIEAVATSESLNQLVRTSKHLRHYVNECAAEISPFDPRVRALKQWTTDLARVPAEFGTALTNSPSAIHWLIPPFCPSDSMLRNTRGPGRKLTVLGAQGKQWDDRLVCLSSRQSQASSFSYGEDFLAVSMTSGHVILYYVTSFQEYRTLNHGEPVRFVSLKSKSCLLATCGMKMLKIWDIRSGETVHTFQSPARPLAMDLYGDKILVASQRGYIASWKIGSSAPEAPTQRLWTDATGSKSLQTQIPSAVALSAGQNMLAVAYSGQPILLWDLAEDAYIGRCGKKKRDGENSTHAVVSLVFNPNPDIALLAVSYLDGDLALLDFSGNQLACFRANCQYLAPSPDGRLLAAGGAEGMIYVFEFDTLNALYQVKSSNSYIKQLGFAQDSLRLADIRGTECTIWEPETLLRDSLSDGSSGTTSNSIVETVSIEAKAKITTISTHPTAEVIFCGKDDGSVSLYDRKTATCLRTFCHHKSAIRITAWCSRQDALLSIDASNRVLLHRFERSAAQGWLADMTEVFRSYLDCEKVVTNVLVGEEVDKFLLSTRESDHMFSLKTGEAETKRVYPDTESSLKWALHPHSPQHLVSVSSNGVSIYRWNDWSKVNFVPVYLGSEIRQLKDATFLSRDQKHYIMLEAMHRNSSSSTSSLTVLNVEALIVGGDQSEPPPDDMYISKPRPGKQSSGQDCDDAASGPPTAPMYPIATFAPNIAHVINISKSGRVVFLDRSSWVCTGELRASERGHDDALVIQVFRHFFVPFHWFAGRRDLVCAVVDKDIILTRGGDLAVVKNGFDVSEAVEAVEGVVGGNRTC